MLPNNLVVPVKRGTVEGHAQDHSTVTIQHISPDPSMQNIYLGHCANHIDAILDNIYFNLVVLYEKHEKENSMFC